MPLAATIIATPSPTREVSPEQVEAVVVAAQDGNTAAFGWLFDHYFDPVVRFAETLLRSHHQAEDAASQTFERILMKINSFDPARGSFFGWACAITRNVIRDNYKAQARRAETPTADHLVGYPADGDGDHATVLATREWLAARLAALPASWAEAMVMRFYLGMSVTETAAALRTTEGNVRNRTYNGVRRINADMTAADRDAFGFTPSGARTVARPAPAPGGGPVRQRTAS